MCAYMRHVYMHCRQVYVQDRCSPEAPYVPAHTVKHRQQDYTGVSPVPDVLSRWPSVLLSPSASLYPFQLARLATFVPQKVG